LGALPTIDDYFGKWLMEWATCLLRLADEPVAAPSDIGVIGR
jgi:hypothetical protein